MRKPVRGFAAAAAAGGLLALAIGAAHAYSPRLLQRFSRVAARVVGSIAVDNAQAASHPRAGDFGTAIQPRATSGTAPGMTTSSAGTADGRELSAAGPSAATAE